jgi:hypothetical protein
MRRNLQTAAPLLRELAALGTQTTATVRFDNFEVMGIVHPDDKHLLPQVAETNGASMSATERAELVQKLKAGIAWTPAGQSPDEMQAEFPHIRMEEGFSGDRGWYSDGYEGTKKIRKQSKLVFAIHCILWHLVLLSLPIESSFESW